VSVWIFQPMVFQPMTVFAPKRVWSMGILLIHVS